MFVFGLFGFRSYIKGIKQRRACLYPVFMVLDLEICYDAAEHEKAVAILSVLRVF